MRIRIAHNGRPIFLGYIALFWAANAYAGNYTNWAVPEQIERVDNGILIKGAYGDVQSCGVADQIYYPKTNEDYELVASMALTALTAGREMRFYVESCEIISFHWTSSGVNTVRNGDGIYIR